MGPKVSLLIFTTIPTNSYWPNKPRRSYAIGNFAAFIYLTECILSQANKINKISVKVKVNMVQPWYAKQESDRFVIAHKLTKAEG